MILSKPERLDALRAAVSITHLIGSGLGRRRKSRQTRFCAIVAVRNINIAVLERRLPAQLIIAGFPVTPISPR